MKLLKKYLFIIGTITIFLITPLSIQLQTNTNFLHKNTELNQNRTNKNLISIELPIANAQAVSKVYSVDGDGYLDCNTKNYPSISCGLVNFTYMITVQAGNYLVGMSATLMDFFLSHSLKSSSYNGSPFIKGGWEILRDITNIVFIFALLFIAFQMVLGGGKGEAKKYLIKIILITLTINFSLFFTYAIIDSSNIFAHVFYNKINQEDVAFQTAKGVDSSVSKKSVSLAIANKINPQKLFMNTTMYTKGEHILMSVMSGVINGVMIYVFLSVSFLFLGRTLGLWLAAILSPLAFASLTVPKMDTIKYVGFKKWLPSLLQMAFMAPIFIFILYLTIQFMNIYTIGTANGMTIDNLLNIIIPLAMITVMLILAKKIANSMAGDFAGIISSFVGKFVGGAIGIGAMAVTGGVAAAGGAAGLAKSGVGQLSRIGNKGKLTEKGEKRVESGRRWRSTKVFDVTKIPGFKKMSSKSGLGGASNFFSKNLAGTSMRGTENKIKLGAMEMREKGQNFSKGKDFKEEEAKYERKKDAYTHEQEKRKEGASTWQEKIVKEKEQADLKHAKDKANSAGSKAEITHEGKTSAAKKKLEEEEIKLNLSQNFKDLSSVIEKQTKKQIDLQEQLLKKEKALKDIPIGHHGEERNSLTDEKKNLEEKINISTNIIKKATLKQKDLSKDKDAAEEKLNESRLTMKESVEKAKAESRKKSAERLVKKDNSLENQRTARKMIDKKGLKSEEEKLVEKLVKEMKEKQK